MKRFKISRKAATIILCAETIFIIACLCFLSLSVKEEQPEQSKTPKEKFTKVIRQSEHAERITETDEYVWTTIAVEARYRPEKEHEPSGTIPQNTMMLRTGRTLDGWSRVTYNDDEYYIEDQYLTNKAPASLKKEDIEEFQGYAFSMFSDLGWDATELNSLIILWNKESCWNPLAENPTSGAYGIPQSLPADKMAVEGDDYRTNARTQMRWGLKYIKEYYGTPTKALEFHLQNNWY